MDSPRILVVRLGAMGDIIHTLPAVASLKHSHPFSRITWAIETKWAPLLEQNPYISRVLPLDRGLSFDWRSLRAEKYEFAVDFQGLTKSALVATLARTDRIYGFAGPREAPAAWFYSHKVSPRADHMVERNLELAASAGAACLLHSFPLPPGSPEGDLPGQDFVLASPLAGWGAKQWPLDFYSSLGRRLETEMGMPLVLNGPSPLNVAHTRTHVSGLAGLIHATRRAAAVVGLDSGPLHLAAALGKPGVALYGPTSPLKNGPYGNSLKVLRSPDAITSYRRTAQPDASMRAMSPDTVFEVLVAQLSALPRLRS